MRLIWKRLTQLGIGLTLLVALLTMSTMGLRAEDGGGETPLPWTTAGEPSQDQLRADGALQVDAVDAAGLVSDDFNSCQLDDALWTYLDPLGEGADYDTNGTQLSITVPPGKNYYLWTEENRAPRVLQDVQNGDFQVVVKFESIPTEPYQLQGIIVQGSGDDANKLLRFEFYSGTPDPDPNTGGPRLFIFAGALVESPTLDFGLAKKNDFIGTIGTGGTDAVDPTQPIYMRVIRGLVGGNYQWEQEYSLDDGATWIGGVVDFSGTTVGGTPVDYNNMLPGQVGIYAGDYSGNAGNSASSPGHTAIFDYFFTTDAPIDPEDGKGYNVTADTVGNGSVAVTPNGAGPYACGEDITLTATPDSGWRFANWSGDISGTDNPLTTPFEMGLMATANFTQDQTYALNVSVAGQGTVTSTDGKIDCGSDCSETYGSGATVTLNAVPASGYIFKNWTGDVPGGANPSNPELALTMDGDKSVTAVFEEESTAQFTVTTQVIGKGTVTSNPAGIDCNANSPAEDCTENFDTGVSVTLTAAPDAGYVFAGWTGDVVSSEASITVTDNTFVLATFVEEAQAKLTVGVSGEGSVTSDVGGINCPGTCTASYATDAAVTLTATPASGYVFSRWTGDLPGGADPASPTLAIVMNGDKSVAAEFVADSSAASYYLPLIRYRGQ